MVKPAQPILAFVISGQGGLHVADYTLHCQGGDIVFFPAGVPKFKKTILFPHGKSTNQSCELLWLYPGQVLHEGLECWISHAEKNNYESSGKLLQPYIKSTQVFLCPSTTRTNLADGGYGANTLVLGEPTTTITIPAIPATANTYMIMDYGTWRICGTYPYVPTNASYLPGIGDIGVSCSGATAGGSQSDCETGRHFGGVNVNFADGHAKWLKTSVVLAEYKKTTPPNGAFNPISE